VRLRLPAEQTPNNHTEHEPEMDAGHVYTLAQVDRAASLHRMGVPRVLASPCSGPPDGVPPVHGLLCRPASCEHWTTAPYIITDPKGAYPP
jgi:hypothetical protein